MKKALFLLCLISFGFLGKAQTDLAKKLIKKTQNYLEEKMVADEIIGLSAALIVEDSIVWEKGYGFADRENQVPMTQNTIVHIGSVTKPVTALCAMQLHEQGLLDIKQPIQQYLPQFNPKNPFGDNSEVKVKHLITHSAGLQADVFKNSDLYSGKYTDVVGFINDTYLMYPPGKMSLYANPGYNILGHIIKEVSGMDYADYVHKYIFQPLGMKQSGFFMDSLKNPTKIYDRKGNLIKEYPLRDIASGGIYCSAHDMALLAKGIINSYHSQSPSLLKSSSMQEVFSIQNVEAEYTIDKNKRGLGWYLFKNEEGLAANHSGSAGFAFAHLMVFPKDKAALVVLSNSPRGRSAAENVGYNLLEDFGLEIADVFPDPLIQVEKEAIDKPIKLSRKSLHKYEGIYSETVSFSKVFWEKDSLKIKRNGETFSLIPQTTTSFIPIDSKGNVIADTYYHFREIATFPCLILKQKNKEQLLGYKLKAFDPKKWEDKIGTYEHFGYQLLAGDSKFKKLELKLSEDEVLIAIISSEEEMQFPLPLDVISEKYARTAGLMSGYAMTLTFTENDSYHILDFAGLTFRKKKLE